MGPWRRGSASRSQREGRGFESRRLHQTVLPVARLTRHPCEQTLIMHWKKRWEGPSRPDGPVVAQPPRKRQVAGSNPARGSREASATPAVRMTGRPGARRHGRLPLRRWCNGKHGGLQNRRSGFESRPACDAAILLFGPSGLRLRGRMATVSECGAVGSARLGAARPRVRVPPFRRERTKQDRACPHEGEIRRMARTRQASVAARRRAPPQTAWRGIDEGPDRFQDRSGPSSIRTAYGFAAQAVGAPPSRERMHDPAPSRGLRPGPWATPPLSGMPEVPATAVRSPAMRRGGRMRTPDTKGAHHVRSGRTQTQIHRGESR